MPLSSTPPIEQKLPVFEPECLGLDLFILGGSCQALDARYPRASKVGVFGGTAVVFGPSNAVRDTSERFQPVSASVCSDRID